jgi:hypothetical protein
MGVRRIDIDGASVTVRRAWTIVLWNVMTFSVYSLVWYYKVNREMRDYGRARGDSELGASKPVRSLLAVTLGGIIVVPELVSLVGVARRVQRSELLATGARRPVAGLIALLVTPTVVTIASNATTSITVGVILACVGAAAYLTAAIRVQARLNAVWLSELASRTDEPPALPAGEATLAAV